MGCMQLNDPLNGYWYPFTFHIYLMSRIEVREPESIKSEFKKIVGH